MSLASMLQPVADLVFPPRCPLCGEGLTAQTGLCAACWGGLAIPGEPACTLCQRPFPDTVGDGAICGPCMASPPRHDGIAAGTLYNEASRRLVLGLKHGGRIGLAPFMARLMAARLGELGPEWLVVPVPLHRWRLWRRGYNQSVLLAGEIARQTGSEACVDALIRARQTPSLGGLGAKARVKVLAGAIEASPKRLTAIKGRPVLLVDDVLTSGATSDACVGVLRRAGAASVRIACFARVLDEALDLT
jgi:ComF family protein